MHHLQHSHYFDHIKSRIMIWVGPVARMGEVREVYRFVWVNLRERDTGESQA
jgi:hypothetical protein